MSVGGDGRRDDGRIEDPVASGIELLEMRPFRSLQGLVSSGAIPRADVKDSPQYGVLGCSALILLVRCVFPFPICEAPGPCVPLLFTAPPRVHLQLSCPCQKLICTPISQDLLRRPAPESTQRAQHLEAFVLHSTWRKCTGWTGCLPSVSSSSCSPFGASEPMLASVPTPSELRAVYTDRSQDVANSYATSVSSKSLTLIQAGILATITEFVGAIALGQQVTSTVRSGVFSITPFNDSPGTLVLAMVVAEVGTQTPATRPAWPSC